MHFSPEPYFMQVSEYLHLAKKKRVQTTDFQIINFVIETFAIKYENLELYLM